MDDRALETKYYKLEKLCKWEQVGTVNEMLLAGVSSRKVSDWCKQMGFTISHPKLDDYKALLQKAITKQVTVERLLGVGMPKRAPIVLQALGIEQAKNMVRMDMEVLDLVIQKGYSSLLLQPEIKVADAMKAIEMKYKITGGSHGGLTGYGIDEIRDLEERKFASIIQVVMRYLPEDKLDEIQEAIAEAERAFYENNAPQYIEQYEQAMRDELLELQSDAGDDTIVSDTAF